MESVSGVSYHPAADMEVRAPEFFEAAKMFRSAVKEFTAAVEKLDNSIAAAMQFANDQEEKKANERRAEIEADDASPYGRTR